MTGLFRQRLYFPDQQESCAGYYLDNDSTMPGNSSDVTGTLTNYHQV